MTRLNDGEMTTAQWRPSRGDERQTTVELELARVNGGLSVDDRQEKYARMAAGAFEFYRGTAHLFYRDLAAAQLLKKSAFHHEYTVTWIQGDMHLNNFGAFHDAAGDVVFDLNDFDEAWVSSYLLDVWRAGCSLVLVAHDNGFDDDQTNIFLDTFARAYLGELFKYRENGHEHLDKVTAANSHGLPRKFLRKAEKKRSRAYLLDNWTVISGEERKFNLADPDLKPVGEDDFAVIKRMVKLYSKQLPDKFPKDFFKVLDVARRINAGIGSLGTPRFYALIRGDSKHLDHGRILDIKGQGLPSFFLFLEPEEQSRLLRFFDADKAGARVVQGQRAMLNDPSKLLGDVNVLGQSFSIRERSPFKKRFKVEKLREFDDFREMCVHWGNILATAHARGDEDHCEILVGHCFESVVCQMVEHHENAFLEEFKAFSKQYAQQVQEDYHLFMLLKKQNRLF